MDKNVQFETKQQIISCYKMILDKTGEFPEYSDLINENCKGILGKIIEFGGIQFVFDALDYKKKTEAIQILE
ncbi:hypothetical protein PGC35_20195 [Psychrobacillus sp. PGGUH221]|uniref:hypothetical protein n=1 Tax=Psychrobacillus sp. PGGUH221 TaxID=3020058 RepID=UPI0035C6CC08